MLPWPHGECPGPGCVEAARVGLLRRDIRVLQIGMQARDAMIVSLFYALKEKEKIPWTSDK